MAVPANIIFIWPSTNSTIPGGWTRETDLDAKYPVGCAAADASGGTTGGGATHTHTVTGTHLHSTVAHRHTVSSNNGTSANSGSFGISRVALTSHFHGGKLSTYKTSYNTDGQSVTFQTASNDPPYYEIIFVKSDGTNGVADDMVAWFDDTLPTDWNEADGGGTRPDLRDRFLKGAAALGNSGGTGGSSDAHQHTENGHTHTEGVHSHSTFTSAIATGGTTVGGTAGNFNITRHTHSIFLNANTATSGSTASTVQNGDGQPPFRKLVAAVNETGGEDEPSGMIGLWKGNKVDIPANWAELTDQREKFCKNASGAGQIGDMGGATQHTHTADAHTHTGVAHAHAETTGSSSLAVSGSITGGGVSAAKFTHTHSNWTTQNATITYNTNTLTLNNVAAGGAYPSWIEMYFIKYTAPIVTEENVPLYYNTWTP